MIQQLVDYKRDQKERRDNQDELTEQMRKLMAILKFPNLSDQFRRIIRKRLSKQSHKEKQNDAFKTVCYFKYDDDKPSNMKKRLKQLSADIDEQLSIKEELCGTGMKSEKKLEQVQGLSPSS